MNYWVFAFGIFCLALRVNGDKDDEHLELREKCFKKLGWTKDEISASDDSVFLQNSKSPCFMECFLDGLNLFNPDGSLNPELTVQAIDADIREQVRELIFKCIGETMNIADKCEKSQAATVCLHKAAGSAFGMLGIYRRPTTA